MRSPIDGFPELDELYQCWQSLGATGIAREEVWVEHGSKKFPILSFQFGRNDPQLPTLVLIAGIHGLEKIGTHILTSYLRSFIRLLHWDRSLVHVLNESRIIFLPLMNPVGMYRNTRSNGSGVDLMRNAPIEAEKDGLPLIQGHRNGPHLPWFRGYEGQGMEIESQFLCDFIKRQCFASRTSLILDVHSGFGWVDRLWFPFAYTSRPFPDAPRMFALKKLLDSSFPHHVYTVEPQFHSYMTHGDLWDYLYLEHQKLESSNVFCPLSLEMGSWHWVRKNPRQLFTSLGIFNPVKPHRIKRMHRRHSPLFNFLIKAIVSSAEWTDLSPSRLSFFAKKARRLWYET